MKIEMEGKEVTWCIGLAALGIPVLTAAILCLGMGIFVWLSPRPQERSPGAAERPIQVTVTPQVQAVLPDGAVQITNTMPPVQIHEVLRDVVQVPDVRIINEVQPAPVHVTQAPAPQPKAVAVPIPVPVAPEEGAEYGAKLPPPKAVSGGR